MLTRGPAPAAPALFALLARLRRATGLAPPPVEAPGAARSLGEAVAAVRDWHRESERRAMLARTAPASDPPATPAPVTLPRHAFEALLRERESAAALRALFDDGALLLLGFEARAPYCVREASPALLQLCGGRLLGAAGQAPGQPLGQPLATLFAPDSARRLLQALGHGGPVTTLELQLSGGGSGWWQLQAGPPDSCGLRQARLLDLQPLRRAQAEAAAQQRRARRSAERLERGQRLREQLQLLAQALPQIDDDAGLRQAVGGAAAAVFPGWQGALWLAEGEEAPLRCVATWPERPAGADEVPGQMLCVPLTAQQPDDPRGALHLQCAVPPPADQRGAWRADAQAFAQGLQQLLALRQLRRALCERSLRDALTGLPGPREFAAALGRETARLRRQAGTQGLALARIEVEHFDSYRTACGGAAADALLRDIAQVLQRFARQDDTVCRLEGAAFALLLPGAPPAAAQARLAQLRTRLAQRPPGVEAGLLARPTVQVGVVEVRGDDHDAGALLERASAAVMPALWLRAVA